MEVSVYVERNPGFETVAFMRVPHYNKAKIKDYGYWLYPAMVWAVPLSLVSGDEYLALDYLSRLGAIQRVTVVKPGVLASKGALSAAYKEAGGEPN